MNMSNKPDMKYHFRRIGNARIYLQEKGFIFTGAPDIWSLIVDDEVLYAQITQGTPGFLISFSSSVPTRTAAV